MAASTQSHLKRPAISEAVAKRARANSKVPCPGNHILPSALELDHLPWLSTSLARVLEVLMYPIVLGLTGEDVQIVGRVVELVLIAVMDNLTGLQGPAELLFGDDTVRMSPVQLRIAFAFTPAAQLIATLLGGRARHPGIVVRRVELLEATLPTAKPLARIFLGNKKFGLAVRAGTDTQNALWVLLVFGLIT